MSTDLPELVIALREAVSVAEGHLSPESLEESTALLAKASARTALGDATVVALAGATGSGKSSIFNALAGAEISQQGALRPTTSATHAAAWGTGPGTESLLDWLSVSQRYYPPEPRADLEGLVLLDLPDHDSTAVNHRLEVDRLVELVDLLIWVVDPQKYADAALHDRFLRPYAEHAGVLMVVLNQADRLNERELEACETDLRRLLDEEQLGAVPTFTASAHTGLGIAALKDELANRVAARRAASERLAADIHAAAAGLAIHCAGENHHGVSQRARADLTTALADASGVAIVATAVERSVRLEGSRVTGWPPLRWLSGLRANPLRRLHLGPGTSSSSRTSLPKPTPAQGARVATALRAIRTDVGDDLPDSWRDDLQRTVEQREDRLPAALDQAIAGTDLDASRPAFWWRGVGALQWLLLALAAVGAVWLLALAGIAYLQLDDLLSPPEIEGLPVPTLLLLGGLFSGALIALLARPFVAAGARHRGRRARGRMLKRIEAVATSEVIAPIEDHGEAYLRFCAAVSRARAN